ncbi:MAG: low-specificity L-threonine aldolase [Deltaproteobacteria bacterium]|nr:low-specificity L-threonine aldolase [Deltaproteobacteria bacterium]
MIDLRSDTVTKPSEGMRKAMAAAEVGDDCYQEDPTTNRLQSMVAEMLGKEAALFMASGTMSNQVALKTHTQPGDEVIAEYDAHIYNIEVGAAAALSGVNVRQVKTPDSILRAEHILPILRPMDKVHGIRQVLICVENTHNRASGAVYPVEVEAELAELAHGRGMATHLDGARLFNACVATGTCPVDHARHFDSISICLSKGLGAPVGSVLVGSTDFIKEAAKVRRMFGGGMRQVGILAAAGIYALENNIKRMQEDHDNARRFAVALAEIPGINLDASKIQTNIVIFGVRGTGLSAAQFVSILREQGVLMNPIEGDRIRAVTHLDVDRKAIDEAIAVIRGVAAGGTRLQAARA